MIHPENLARPREVHAKSAHRLDTTIEPSETESRRTVDLKFGMWVFLANEILLFGSFFAIYWWNRSSHLQDFEAGSQKLEFLAGTINTAVLLTSSLAMAFAIRFLKLRQRKLALASLIAVEGFGVLFLAIKAVEYWHHYKDHQFPGLDFSAASSGGHNLFMFMSLYIYGTGLHAVHMLIGLLLVAFLFFRILKSDDLPMNLSENTGLYWHFVDIVWIFLFPAFYLIGGR